jgi:hypothetical protein
MKGLPMKGSVARFILVVCAATLFALPTQAAPVGKVMVLDYQLNDMTDLPNAPEELERIGLLSSIFKQRLADNGVELVPVNEALKNAVEKQSPTYLFDNVPNAAKMAEGSGADYLLIGVALKPTYLFVYPRILLVDIRTAEVIMARASQLESSWSDENTTRRTAEKIADMVTAELKALQANRLD